MSDIKQFENKIIQGNTLEVLKTFPDESVDCIITSPPYWGLRDYGEETKVKWGGNKNCKHIWEERIKKWHSDRGKGPRKEIFDDTFQVKGTTTDFCQKCGAWYGQLGLESTIELYLEHLLQITAELKRVLKKSGVMFWNHGDCYGGSGMGTWKNPPKKINSKEIYHIPYGSNVPIRRNREMAKCLMLQNWRLILRMIDGVEQYHIKDSGERGWLAGFIDGEGTIGIQRLKRANPKFKDAYSIYLRAVSTDKNAIEKCIRLTGFGHCRIKKPTKTQLGSRIVWSWDTYATQAQTIIRDIYPLLEIKKQQALVANTLQNILSHEKAKRWEDREELYQAIKALNQRKNITLPKWLEEPEMNRFGGGWILRNTIIWYKPNAMPSSVKDRFANKYENVYMLVKNKKYWFDLDVVRVSISEISQRRAEYENRRIKEGKGISKIGYKSDYYGMPARFVKLSPAGKNPGDVWRIPTQSFKGDHFATFPEKLIEPMILAGCPKEGIVLDPFIGSGTTGVVAKKLGRNYLGIELSPPYVKMAEERIKAVSQSLF